MTSNQGEIEDTGEDFLRTAGLIPGAADVLFMTALTRTIDLLWNTMRDEQDELKAEACRLLLLFALAECHVFVDKTVYSKILQRQQAALQTVRLVFSTSTTLVKVNAQRTSWSDWAQSAFPRSVLVVDALEHLSAEEFPAFA